VCDVCVCVCVCMYIAQLVRTTVKHLSEKKKLQQNDEDSDHKIERIDDADDAHLNDDTSKKKGCCDM